MVARETGLTIKFDDPSVEHIVHTEPLRGNVDGEPRIALYQGLLTVGLTYAIDSQKGEITIAD